MAKYNYWKPRPKPKTESKPKRHISPEEWRAFKNDGIPLGQNADGCVTGTCGFGDCPDCYPDR